jgi:hypothetical protein
VPRPHTYAGQYPAQNERFGVHGIPQREKLFANIPEILKAFPNTTFRSTIYAPTAHKTFENYIFANFCGFKNIFLIPDARHPWTQEQKNALKDELDKIYSYISWCFNNNILPMNFRPINESFE